LSYTKVSMRLKSIRPEILILFAAAALVGCATPPPQTQALQESSSPPLPGMCERPGSRNAYDPRGPGEARIQRQEAQQHQGDLNGQAHAGTQGLYGQQGGQDTGGQDTGGQDTGGEGDFGGSTGSGEMTTGEQATGATGGSHEYELQRNEGSIESGAGRRIGPLRQKRVPWSERPADRTEGCEDDDTVLTRQLCEAAMKEDDPFLRSALWDEYDGYKKILARFVGLPL